MVGAVWTLIGVIVAGGVAAFGLLRGALRDLDAKITGLDTKLTGEIGGLDTKLTGAIGRLDAKLTGEITGLDTKLTGEFAQVRSDITHLAESVGHIQGTLDEHLRRHDAGAVAT